MERKGFWTRRLKVEGRRLKGKQPMHGFLTG
jgi:hypothetical protein